MKPYIFCTRNKVHIINLDKTIAYYRHAVNFISSVAAKNGKILFVGTKQQAKDLVRTEAQRCQMPYVDDRWLGGMLTNYKTIRQSLKRLQELEMLRDSPTFAQMTKKEALAVMREITKLERSLGGVREMGGLPDAIFVIDVGNEHIAVTEAIKLKIPIVGIVDTNNDPDGIDYVIPGNDDSIRAIKLYLQGMVDAIIAARAPIIEQEAAIKKEEKVVKKPAPVKKKVVKRKTTTVGEENKKEKPKTKVVRRRKSTTEKKVSTKREEK